MLLLCRLKPFSSSRCLIRHNLVNELFHSNAIVTSSSESQKSGGTVVEYKDARTGETRYRLTDEKVVAKPVEKAKIKNNLLHESHQTSVLEISVEEEERRRILLEKSRDSLEEYKDPKTGETIRKWGPEVTEWRKQTAETEILPVSKLFYFISCLKAPYLCVFSLFMSF
jgi:hypothetical protein